MKGLILVCVLVVCSTALSAAQWRNKVVGATNTELLGYNAKTNPNRSGIVSVTMHQNKVTFYLDGVTVGRHFNYCHIDSNGQLHRQGFEYTSPTHTMFVELVGATDTVTGAIANTLDIYIDDVLVHTFVNWCEQKQP